MIPFDTAVLLADDGGAPRMRIEHGERVLYDAFVFDSGLRSGLHGAYLNGGVYVGPGVGGGPVEAAFTLQGVELSRVFVGYSGNRDGWNPTARELPAHPLSEPIIPIVGTVGREAVTNWVRWIPTPVQELILSIGGRIQLHNMFYGEWLGLPLDHPRYDSTSWYGAYVAWCHVRDGLHGVTHEIRSYQRRSICGRFRRLVYVRDRCTRGVQCQK